MFSQLRAVPRCVSPRPSGDHHADRCTTRPYLWPRSRLRILFPCLTSHSSRTHRSPERRSTHELLPYPKPAVHLPGFPSSHDTVSLDVDDNVGAIQRHLVPAQSDLLICKTIPGRHMEFHTVPRADDHFAVMDPLRLPACALIGFERAGDDASPGSSSVATWQESVPRRTRVSGFCTESAAPFTGTLSPSDATPPPARSAGRSSDDRPPDATNRRRRSVRHGQCVVPGHANGVSQDIGMD